MKKTNGLFIIWGILVVTLVILLTIIGFILKKTDKTYSKLEEKLVEVAEKYVDAKFLYPSDGFTTKVLASDLIKDDYLDELKIDNDTCDGYVIVSKEMVYKYKAYIKCNKYTTKGYEK